MSKKSKAGAFVRDINEWRSPLLGSNRLGTGPCCRHRSIALQLNVIMVIRLLVCMLMRTRTRVHGVHEVHGGAVTCVGVLHDHRLTPTHKSSSLLAPLEPCSSVVEELFAPLVV